MKALLGRSKGRYLKIDAGTTEKVPYGESVGQARDVFAKFKKGAASRRQSVATSKLLSPTTYTVTARQEKQDDAANSLMDLFQKLESQNTTR